MKMQFNPRPYYVVLALLCALITYICVTSGCRTVKKSSVLSRTEIDTTSKIKTNGYKETLIREKTSEPVVFNPGSFSGYYNPLDTAEQIFETVAYKIVIKPGSVAVSGKDQKVPVPGNKDTHIRESQNTDQETRGQSTTVNESKSKEKTSVPFPVIIFSSIIVLLILFLLFRFLIKEKIN